MKSRVNPLDIKSIIAAMGTAIALLAIALALSLFQKNSTTPIGTVEAYYQADKIFYPQGIGAEHQRLKQLIAPRTWNCIENQWMEAEQGIEHGPGESIGYNCGMKDLGFYQDSYPKEMVEFKIISETSTTADVEIAIKDVEQIKLRYFLVQSGGTWRIVRGEIFGSEGAAQFDFPEEEEIIVRNIAGLRWDWMPSDQYWYPYNGDPDNRILEGTSLFSRSESVKFSDAFADFDPDLTKLGWQQDPQVAADGPTSSFMGYKRQVGDRQQYLIFLYETTFLQEQSPDEPPSCPCIYTNKIFFADE